MNVQKGGCEVAHLHNLIKMEYKNGSKGPVLIGLEEIVQRQVGVGVGRGR